MSQLANPSSSDDPELVLAFEKNEFDLAGLADLANDDHTVDLALHALHLILLNETEPRRSNRSRLARVLLAMTAVARDDYAGSGHQEYWPFLFDRIAKVEYGNVDSRDFARLRTQPHQSLLGRWFRFALEDFGYTSPEEGQTYVTPIVFHAGIPRTSLTGVVQLIDTAVRRYGQDAVNLPHDLRSQLAKNHIPPLHRNVERLLTSRLTGASQIWNCLARVIFAWRHYGDCSEELRQLPVALDADDVRQSLPAKDAGSASRKTRTQLPRIRFDVSTGEVRLMLPSGSSGDWDVSGLGDRALRWNHTHLGLTAEILHPPPENISVAQRHGVEKIKRGFSTRPSQWRGIWFHASNGNLEDGATIDTNGLEPGRWYVLFEGTPTDSNIPPVYPVPLKWNCFAGHQHWTAWEIDVPPRSQDCSFLEWYVDGNRCHIPLTRRPGARVETCNTPFAEATTATGEVLKVFSDSPIIRLCRDRNLGVTLFRDTDDGLEVLHRADLPADEPWQVPVCEPGVYQLREARGVCRLLLHFALIPRAEVRGPIYDPSKLTVAIELTDTESSGQVMSAGKNAATQQGAFRVEQSTVAPLLEFDWAWRNDIAAPRLTFQWPVEGVRWRVVGLSEDAARWTRETLFISPKDVAKLDAQFEIHVPSNAELRVNEVTYAGKLQRGVGGSGLSLSLLPFGEVVQVSVDDAEPLIAVVISDRPVIDSLDAISDGESVLVTWKSRTSRPGMVLVAWNPLQPNRNPLQFCLTDKQLSEQACEFPCAQLPGEWCSIAIGRLVRSGFTKQVLHIGAADSDPSRPFSILMNLKTGATTSPKNDTPGTWIEFLHGLTLDRLSRSLRSSEEILRFLSRVDDHADNRLDECFQLDSLLAAADSAFDENWRSNTRQAVMQFVASIAANRPARVFRNSRLQSPNTVLQRLLCMGVPIGQSCPQKWLIDDPAVEEATCAYPFSFIRDLWLLGTRNADVVKPTKGTNGGTFSGYGERQKAAAERVWGFLKSHELSFATQLLPMLQRAAWVRNSDCGHCHSLALLSRNLQAEQDFIDALGLDSIALDCQATRDDVFWGNKSPNKNGVLHNTDATRTMSCQRQQKDVRQDYSLFWDHDEQQWYIERPGTSSPTCCRTPILCAPPIMPEKLIDDLDLRKILERWARIDAASHIDNRLIQELADRFVETLCSDSVTGSLHTELLSATQAETKELFGMVVVVPTKVALHERARIAWQLAWVERLTAWQMSDHFSRNDPAVPGQHEAFLKTLSLAFEAWPKLMRRCLSLVELLIWTCYRGGLGVAMRFSSEAPRSSSATSPVPHKSLPAEKPPLIDFVQRPPKPTVVTGAMGVIIDCGADFGRIVIKHPSSPSLAATVTAYLEPKQDSHSWIVRFGWKAIVDSDRHKLTELYAANRRSRDPNIAGTLADFLRGMTVHCELQKTHAWEVVSMRIAFDRQKFDLTPTRRLASER